MTQESLFGETIEHPTEKPVEWVPVKHRVLITVKAAPNPSAIYGETVCVAGIRLADTGPKDWIRLYPINFRHLPEASARFKKYDIVTVEARPAGEARLESWRPNMATLQVETHIPPWKKRRQLVDPMIDDSMCKIRTDAAADPRARSLALVRPTEILGFRLEHGANYLLTATGATTGELTCFANDVPFAYINNKGYVSLTIERTRLGGAFAQCGRL